MKNFMLVAMITILFCGCQVSPEESETKHIRGKSDATYTKKHNRAFMHSRMTRIEESGEEKNKKPVLFYYAVDTEEPFMQMSTDYEVRALRASCNTKVKTNFILFLNSHISKANYFFQWCREGVLRESEIVGLSEIVSKISDPEFDNSKPQDESFIPLGHKRKYNKMFAQYPLAHPEVLWALLDLSNRHYFPVDEYKYFMHLRSHGGKELLLSGLTPELLEKKNKSQVPVEKKYLDAIAKVKFKNLAQGKKVQCEANGGFMRGGNCYCWNNSHDEARGTCKRAVAFTGMGESQPGELAFGSMNLGRASVSSNYAEIFESMSWTGEGMGWLGEGMGWIGEGMGWIGEGMGYMGEGMGYMGEGMGWLGEGMGWYGEGMGWYGEGMGWMGEGMGYFGQGMGWMGEGLGISGNGLGIEEGLSTANFYGTDHRAMISVLRRARSDGFKFGFIFFEACSSSVGTSKHLAGVLERELDNVDAYYSASGALWYRNIDWHSLMFWAHAAKGDAALNLTQLASKWSEKIDTFVEE